MREQENEIKVIINKWKKNDTFSEKIAFVAKCALLSTQKYSLLKPFSVLVYDFYYMFIVTML